jgi:hypothetical protein
MEGCKGRSRGIGRGAGGEDIELARNVSERVHDWGAVEPRGQKSEVGCI